MRSNKGARRAGVDRTCTTGRIYGGSPRQSRRIQTEMTPSTAKSPIRYCGRWPGVCDTTKLLLSSLNVSVPASGAASARRCRTGRRPGGERCASAGTPVGRNGASAPSAAPSPVGWRQVGGLGGSGNASALTPFRTADTASPVTGLTQHEKPAQVTYPLFPEPKELRRRHQPL